MKKFDIKKIGIILAIVVVIVLAIFLIGKAIKGGSVDKETISKYENYTIEYYLNLTSGLNTPYGGVEALYSTDETTFDDISPRQMLHTAIDYIEKEGKATDYNYATLYALYKDKYPEIEKSGIYSAATIREAIKTLFDVDDFANLTIEADATFLITYKYLAEEDMYLVYDDKDKSVRDFKQSLDYSLIETTTKKDKIITTVAIAYCYQDGEKYIYASDRFGENVVEKSASKFPTDKVDKFDKFEFTLTKTKDGNYIFESVKKVK